MTTTATTCDCARYPAMHDQNGICNQWGAHAENPDDPPREWRIIPCVHPTPGPWTVETDSDLYGRYVVVEAVRQMREMENAITGDETHVDAAYERIATLDRANARLIEAAPVMYDALAALVSVGDGIGSYYVDDALYCTRCDAPRVPLAAGTDALQHKDGCSIAEALRALRLADEATR